MNSNAKKLAIAIGLLKERKCECKPNNMINHVCHTGMPKMGVPIVEIDGVKNISSNIHFYQKKQGLCFEVEADFKYDSDDENPKMYMKTKYNQDGINKEDILQFSCELLEELPQIRLGLHGNLLIRDAQYVSLRTAFEDVFAAIECETIKVDKTGDCCVCYEKTDTKTPCEHSLCNRCWSKIEICGEDNNECSCPMCRKNIYYL